MLLRVCPQHKHQSSRRGCIATAEQSPLCQHDIAVRRKATQVALFTRTGAAVFVQRNSGLYVPQTATCLQQLWCKGSSHTVHSCCKDLEGLC